MSARLALVLALALTSVAGAAEPATRAETHQKLDHTRQDLKQIEQQKRLAAKRLKEHTQAEKNILGQLDGINRKAEAAQRDARVHVRNLGLVEDRLSALRLRQAQASAQEEADRGALRAQLRAVQRSRARQGAALLFSARTPAQWAARSSALRELSSGTQRKVLALRQRLDLLNGYRQEYSQREQELLRSRGEAEGARTRYLQEAVKRQALLKGVRSKKAQAQQMVASLEQTASRLQDLMDALQEQAKQQARRKPAASQPHGSHKMTQTTDGPSTLHGRAPWPVTGKLLSRFGKQRHPVLNVNVFNRGIEIAAPFGSLIKSISAGTVEYVGDMQNLGTLVVVDHGGGLKSVYGYASQALVKLGQAVARGEALAEVGEHGTSGQPSLYFQISQNARPQDPLRYLSFRR